MTVLDADTLATTIGLDVPVGTGLRLGVTGDYRKMDGRLAFGSPLRADAWTAGGYAAIETRADRIGRVSAYGQTASGRTKGNGWAASGEAGWQLPFGGELGVQLGAIRPAIRGGYSIKRERGAALFEIDRSSARQHGTEQRLWRSHDRHA